MAVTQTDIQGVWKLLFFNLHLTSNPSSAPIYQTLSTSPLGRIIFLPNGYISCTITSSESLKPIEASNLFSASDKHVLRIARSITTYCGYYRMYEESRTTILSTSIDIAIDPNWVGGQQVRNVRVRREDGEEHLVLSPVQDFLLPVSENHLGQMPTLY